MYDLGSGILVHFDNKKEIRNTVFYQDNKYAYYQTGKMLFELIKDDAIYLVTTKVENMIRIFPDYNKEVSVDSITDGFKWLYGTIEDERMPVATELFRGCFNEKIMEVAGSEEAFECVGDFFSRCYEEYLAHVKMFAMYIVAIAEYNSGTADEFQEELACELISSAEELYELYTRKLSVRKTNGRVSVSTIQIKNYLQLLMFEYCRMKKENKPLKICVNCGRFFIPPKRRDSIYCHAPSPQNPERTCSEVGANYRQTLKRRNDPVEREHHANSGRLHNMIRRLTETGAAEEHIEKYKKALQKENEKYLSEKWADTDSDNT